MPHLACWHFWVTEGVLHKFDTSSTTLAAIAHMLLPTSPFEVTDFVRTGLVLTIITPAIMILLGATYWRWLGYV